MAETGAPDWRPGATPDTLRARAQFLARLRAFFAAREILEVETPVLGRGGSTDIHLHSFLTRYAGPGPGAAQGETLYLHTSPEFCMKRLLAAGSGAIYQVCKVFRNEELGRLHNPEFTMLEWYRPGWDHHALMAELEALLHHLGYLPAQTIIPRWRYFELFENVLGQDVTQLDRAALLRLAAQWLEVPPSMAQAASAQDLDEVLDLLLSQVIEPRLRAQPAILIYDYPASQAALARVRPGTPAVAERFELFCQGIEIANGFHELTDAGEQARRFAEDNRLRQQAGRETVRADARLLAALEHGLPDCAGVAVGLDRLFMLLQGLPDVASTLGFDFTRV